MNGLIKEKHRCKKPELCWNVYREDFNKREIEIYNIFDHYRFVKDCAKGLKKVKDDYEAGKKIFKSNLIYFFWSKCEHEVLIAAWANPLNQDICRKVDVYEQVMNNWHTFIEYAWKHRKDVIKLAQYNDRKISD